MRMDNVLRVAAYAIYGLVAFLLVGAILIQESKGGGLAALGGTRGFRSIWYSRVVSCF